MSDSGDQAVTAISELLRESESAVALTGAGVSTASGIPSYRGEDGIWEQHDPMDFHRRRFEADPAGFWSDRISLRESIYGELEPEPNAAHEALAKLESSGILDAVVTQNIDGLHRDAGSATLIELHGNNQRVVCDDCDATEPAAPIFASAADGEVPPRCSCGGIYRPDVVLFGEPLPDGPIDEAQRLARESEVFLAIGSSLSVQPASLLPDIAVESGGELVIINYEPTSADADATVVLSADVTDVLPEIATKID